MKKLIGILAISAITVSAFAQGTVTLLNNTGLAKQWTSTADSTLISVPKSGGSVILLAAPSGTLLPNPLFTAVAGGETANYSSLAGFLAANPGWAQTASNLGNPAPSGLIAAAAGVFNLGTRTISNIGEGANASYVVLGWTGNFTTFDQALAAANGSSSASFLGISAIATTKTGDPLASPPGTAVSLTTSFAGVTLAPIVAVPEPSTFALAGLGAAALLIFRRRK